MLIKLVTFVNQSNMSKVISRTEFAKVDYTVNRARRYLPGLLIETPGSFRFLCNLEFNGYMPQFFTFIVENKISQPHLRN